MHFPKIIERHADEAGFLWDQRRRAAVSPVFDLASFALLDLRVDANLEGLVVAGEHGLRAAMEALERRSRAARAGRPDDGAELFPAIFTAAEIGDTMALAKLLVRAGQHPRGEEALISALGFLSPATATRVLADLVADECPPVLRRLGIAGFSARRAVSSSGADSGAWLPKALASDDDSVRSRAFRAVGEIGRRDLAGSLRAEVRSRGDEADPWALWSLALFGEESAAAPLFRVAESDSPAAPHAAALAAILSPRSESVTRLLALGDSQVVHRWRAALAGMEALGDPVFLPWLVGTIESRPETSRRAAWVYSSITGVLLEPPLAIRTSSEEPSDEALAWRRTDPFEDLPTPQPEAIRDHFHRIEKTFTPGERRLAGKVMDSTVLREILKTGLQPSRAVAALELARTAATTSLFPVQAPAFLQKAHLATAAP